MKTILYSGSFDPVTIGHMDLIERACPLADRVLIGIGYNPDKHGGLFPIETRVEMLKRATAHLQKVEVITFTGLLIDAARQHHVDAVLRGLRDAADLDLELQMARLNRQLGQVETIFMAASPHTLHISSSMVRQIGIMGGPYRELVPVEILPILKTVFHEDTK